MSDRQAHLFDTEPEPWELDDAALRPIATVVPAKGPDAEYDYLVPDSLLEKLQPGCRVEVPLGRGNRATIGYCIGFETRPVGSRKLKSIQRILDAKPLLSAAMLRLTRWMADYYLCSHSHVLHAVVPAGVRAQAGTRTATVLSVSKTVPASLDDLKLPTKQRKALETLQQSSQPLSSTELASRAGCTLGPIGELRKKGLLVARKQRIANYRPSDEPALERDQRLEMNAEQRQALQAIGETLNAGRHETLLLHGVTGSGKTEVYLQAIDEVLQFGRQSIVLVPEISLTPQTCERFRRRFGRVAVMHSHQTDVERAWHWEQIASGEVPVVIGARSAIFAPTPHLGLIVLDEEHESTFKQNSSPRYHARDVALQRAQAEGVPLVLGSATPSLESWQRAVDKQYRLISMPRRVLNRSLPDVVTVDLRQESASKLGRGAISRRLSQAMHQALAAGGQVILLLNRRGFATHIQCPACGHVVSCPDCDIALTHHRREESALCHYCDHEIPAPVACPECRSPQIRYSGRGTQRLEAEVRATFGQYDCLRMDTDSMQRPGSHEKALERFRRGEVQILLGTQMIAKGLDFPNVRLVGVINADTALHLPDFRAAERTFQLVTQVAGRTGRGAEAGRVLVQTFNPDHPAIAAAVRHDYHRFAASELPLRRDLGYPPFAMMFRLIIRGEQEGRARDFALVLTDLISAQCAEHAGGHKVLGPAPAPMSRLRGKYRFHTLIQSPQAEPLRAAIAKARTLKTPDDVEWIADVDPLEML